MNVYHIATLTLGLVSSMHCIGMCGPIALALPLNRSSVWTMLGGLLINNLSRIIGYALLGMIAGSLGQVFVIAGLQNYLSIASGVLMLIVLTLSVSRIRVPQPVHLTGGKWKAAAARLFGHSSTYTLAMIGLLNALLPCGMVYMALAGAAGTGNVWSGAFFMILFGSGTAPALIAVAFAGQFVSLKFRENIRRFTPVLVCLLACILILRGLNLNIPYLSPPAAYEAIPECCTK